jgi:hypothetical protein
MLKNEAESGRTFHSEPTHAAADPRFLGGSEEKRHYSWLEDYLAWLDGEEARREYHALLEQEIPH